MLKIFTDLFRGTKKTPNNEPSLSPVLDLAPTSHNEKRKTELLEKYTAIFSTTGLPAIALYADDTKAHDEINPTASRMGGKGVLLRGEPWPQQNETDLVFLMQINLAQNTSLDWLPKTGYLQFWVGADEMYGCYDFPARPGGKNAFMVRYLEPDADLVLRDVPSLEYQSNSPFWTTHGTSALLKGVSAVQQPSSAATESIKNDGLFDIIEEYVSLGGSDSDMWGARHADGRVWDAKAWLGGHPDYTQSDPRYEDIFDGYVTLATIDSATFGPVETMWGDCGIATFYVKPEEARSGDFSTVLYYFDCC